MSDVTVAAPPGGAPSASPSAPAPAPSEVVINQNPTSHHNPVGAQTPDKPAEDKGPRTAIQAAYDRAAKMQATGEKPAPRRAQAEQKAPAAEAKAGHNQPPEETPKEQPKGDNRYREGGRFARAPEVGTPGQPSDAQDARARPGTPGHAQDAQRANPLPDHAPYREPPGRFADHAKAEWAATPESVRGEVHRAQQEFAKAFKYYKDGHEAFQPLRQYHQMAQEHGTTLDKALNNYVTMEAKLRADPIAGLDQIVNNLGLKSADGQPIGFRDIAYHVLSQSPEQLKQLQMGNQQQAANQQLGALHQEIMGLKSQLQQMHTQQQFTQTRSQVDQFAETHPRIDEEAFANTVKQELSFGFDLATAYRRAEAFHPATQAAQTRTQSAQTRTPDRSIYGVPASPSNGASHRPREPSGTSRAAIERAVRLAHGGI